MKLDRVKEALRQKCFDLVKILHQDNTRARSTKQTQENIRWLEWEGLQDLPYSTDLPSTDPNLFHKWQNIQKKIKTVFQTFFQAKKNHLSLNVEATNH